MPEARTKKGRRLHEEASAQEYRIVAIAKLKEHPRNPRRGSVAAIDESIDVNGWYGAAVVQRSTGFILAGNHRVRVAKKRGATEIPVILRDCSDEEALRILLADNKTADLGGYDEALLGEILEGLESVAGTGYDPALEQVIEEAEAEAEAEGDAPIDQPVPEDSYEPQFAVIVVLQTEEDQQSVYEQLTGDGLLPEGADVRVTAV